MVLGPWHRILDLRPGRRRPCPVVGRDLRTRLRSEFVISTKVGRVLERPSHPEQFDRSPWAGGLNFDIRFDYTYDGIMRSYEQSLMRLGLDTVDALVVHDLDADYYQPDEVYFERRRNLVNSGNRLRGY